MVLTIPRIGIMIYQFEVVSIFLNTIPHLLKGSTYLFHDNLGEQPRPKLEERATAKPVVLQRASVRSGQCFELDSYLCSDVKCDGI